jgi:hypothetical protein
VVLSLSLGRLDALIWALIYAGLVGIALALALRAATPELALVAGVGGIVGLVAGIALVAYRARVAHRGIDADPSPSSRPKTPESPR